MSVVIHEVSHGVVAERLGDPTARMAGRLTLNPLPHIDTMGSIIVPIVVYFATFGTATFGWAKPVPVNHYNLRAGKWGPALVAAAGPASNLLLALIFGLIIRFGGASLSPGFIQMSAVIVIINVMLAIFNLIPIPPIDGSHILSAFIPHHYRKFELAIGRYYWFIIAFILFFGWRLIQYPILWITSLFTGLPLS